MNLNQALSAPEYETPKTNQGLSNPDDRLYRAFKVSYEQKRNDSIRTEKIYDSRSMHVERMTQPDNTGRRQPGRTDNTGGRQPGRTEPTSTRGTSGSRWSAARKGSSCRSTGAQASPPRRQTSWPAPKQSNPIIQHEWHAKERPIAQVGCKCCNSRPSNRWGCRRRRTRRRCAGRPGRPGRGGSHRHSK